MTSIDLCVHGMLAGGVLTADDGQRWTIPGTVCAAPLTGFFQLGVVTPPDGETPGEAVILRTVYDS